MTLRTVYLLLVLLVLLAFAGGAHAQTTVSPVGGASFNFGAGSVAVGDGSDFSRLLGRTFIPAENGAVAAVERYGLSVGGQALEVAAARVIPAGAVAQAAAVAFAAGWEVGGAAQHWIGQDTSVSVGPTRCVTSSTGWQCDSGTAPSASSTGTGYRPSMSPACPDSATPMGQAPCNIVNQFGRQYSEIGTCRITSENDNNVFGNCDALPFMPGTWSWVMTKITMPVSGGCPASTDALNPAWSVPAGSAPDPDGRCRTGRYTAASPATVAARLVAPNVSPSYSGQVVSQILAHGQPITGASPRTLSGPTTTAGPTTTTTTTAPGGATATTTSNVTNNYTYSGSTISYTTTNVTNNPDGSTTTSTNPQPPPDVAPPTDPAMPPVPDLYTRKYPDGVQGVWSSHSAALSSTPMMTFLSQLAPAAGGTTCPHWTLPSGNLLGISVGGDVSIPCNVWTFIRLVMVISALLLARRLIFGG